MKNGIDLEKVYREMVRPNLSEKEVKAMDHAMAIAETTSDENVDQ